MNDKDYPNEDFFDNTVDNEYAENIGVGFLTNILYFLSPVCLGALITFVVVTIFSRGSLRPILHHICNGLFIASVVLTGFGGLSVINKSGFFDVTQFGFKQLKEMVIKNKKKSAHESRTDNDFLQFKREKRKKRKGRWNWVIAGVVYFLAALATLKFL